MRSESLHQRIAKMAEAQNRLQVTSHRGLLVGTVVLLITLCVAHDRAGAQHSIGIEGGYSHIWERQFEQPSGNAYEFLDITGLSAGILKVTYGSALSEIIGIHAAIGYGTIGSRNNFRYPSADYLERRFNAIFTDVALAGQTNTRPLRLVGRLGIRLGYVIDLNEVLFRNSIPVVESELDTSINRAYGSVVVASGGAWNISNSIRIVVIGEYAVGVTSLWKKDVFIGDSQLDRYPYVLSLLTGVQFNL